MAKEMKYIYSGINCISKLIKIPLYFQVASLREELKEFRKSCGGSKNETSQQVCIP